MNNVRITIEIDTSKNAACADPSDPCCIANIKDLFVYSLHELLNLKLNSKSENEKYQQALTKLYSEDYDLYKQILDNMKVEKI